MTDELVRELQRKAEQGDPQARAQWLTLCARLGLGCPQGHESEYQEIVFTIYREQITDIAFASVKGRYQKDLLTGSAIWSGADLRGKARQYGAKYARSRNSLLENINQNLESISDLVGLDIHVGTIIDNTRNQKRRLVLVVGALLLDWVDEV